MMRQSEDDKFIPMTSVTGGTENSVRKDVHFLTDQIVNVIFLGEEQSSEWVLIDTGMPKSSSNIFEVSEKRFGKDSRPKAIILTHGHFDHVGGIVDLIQKWKVPVYAHSLELPFLTGKEAYPEPDPTVEGGMLAKLSSIYPYKPIDISEVVQELPADNSVPFLPEWKWIHTPGHSRGHVSFFRESDSTLIAGDAFITVKQDSLYRVLVQKKEIQGPPRYLTPDWDQAKTSVEKLYSLRPDAAVTGHGPAMEGEELRKGLQQLRDNFEKIAIPAKGKYVDKENKKDDL